MEVIRRRLPSISGSRNLETSADRHPRDLVVNIRRSKIRTEASDDPTAK
jgi:hypothetical protein